MSLQKERPEENRCRSIAGRPNIDEIKNGIMNVIIIATGASNLNEVIKVYKKVIGSNFSAIYSE